MQSINELPTPALILDASVVHSNIQRLADYSAQTGLKIRPHTKTHKSRQVAIYQQEAGAIGLTMAKVGEALALSAVDGDLLLAYPPVDNFRAQRLAHLAHDRTVRAAIDSTIALDAVAGAAQRAGVTIGLLVDLDVGMGRTGLQSPSQALALARAIECTTGVRLDGILCYPGHIWQLAEEQLAALQAVDAKLEETIDCWSQSGLPANIVSGGSTPTAYQSHRITHLTEIRPGTYVYNDMNTVHGNFCTLDDCAARIVCTVISAAVPGQVVIDAGSKTLTSDRCLPAPQSGYGYVVEYPHAKITHLSEEHGQVNTTACDRLPSVGERVTVIPNHICPCINLQDSVWWCETAESPRVLTIDARGKLS